MKKLLIGFAIPAISLTALAIASTPVTWSAASSVSLGASSDSDAVGQGLNSAFGIDCAIVTTAGQTPAGTLTVQGSVDGTNFALIPGSSQAVSQAQNTTIHYIFGEALFAFPQWRIDYARTSSTGTLSCNYSFSSN